MSPRPNRLAQETSPYLLQHAAQPVDWHPWGEEAFATARREGRLLFLSIGYATCHWCHVMARESFDDPAVAALLNQHFVNVKVDREERPDIDRAYMAFVQATTGSGGWPMSVWLTPELEPFFGGTYFPPLGAPGRASFADVIEAVAAAWMRQPGKIREQARHIAESLRRLGEMSSVTSEGAQDPGEEGLLRCAQALAQGYDERDGGFGAAPKFPRPAGLIGLLQAARCPGASPQDRLNWRAMVSHTLGRMAAGGVYDQVGGGIHRYAVDRSWAVPHFEKMLYDQAQVASLAVDLYAECGDAAWADLARDILAYVRRDLALPEGGLAAGEDADSPQAGEQGHGSEGAYYLWTAAELTEALGSEDALFAAQVGGVDPLGNVSPEHDPHGEMAGGNILQRRSPWPSPGGEAAVGRWAVIRNRLLEHRYRRPRPARDDKVIAAWNGWHLSALSRAARILGEASWGDDAVRCALFLQSEMWDPQARTLYRSWRRVRSPVAAFAEDYAALIQGLIDLYEWGADLRWLRWAEVLQGAMLERFLDPSDGAFYNAAPGDASLIARFKDDYDGAEPSANSTAALNLLRLGAMLGRGDWEEAAARLIRARRATWSRQPEACPLLLVAAAWVQRGMTRVVVVGDPVSETAARLARVVHALPWGPYVLLYADGGEGQQWLASLDPSVAAMRPSSAGAVASICRGKVCSAPTSDADTLSRWLRQTESVG